MGYGVDLCRRIEEQYEMYQQGKGANGIKLFLGARYVIDFRDMKQVNMLTNYTRPVTRTQY